MAFGQQVRKALDPIPARTLEFAARPGIEGDQVDLGRHVLQQVREPARVLVGIVDAGQHDIFEGDAPGVVDAGIVAAGLQKLGDGVLLVERNDAVAHLVGGGMQADRQIDPQFLPAATHHRDHAGGGEGDSAPAERDAVRIGDDLHGLGHVVVVVERLAHAHQHDVRQTAVFARRRPFAQKVAGQHDLADDLARGKVAHQTLGAGVAELTGQRAADLAGNAECAPVAFRDVDHLRLVAVGEGQQPLLRPVAGDLMAGDAGAIEPEGPGQPAAEGLREVRHGGEVGRAVVIDPLPELLGTEGGFAQIAQRRGHLGQIETDQMTAGAIALGGRRENLGMGSVRHGGLLKQSAALRQESWRRRGDGAAPTVRRLPATNDRRR